MNQPKDPTRPPVSDRQRAANIANAQKSTGPVTEEGKRICRANALKHTLNATVCIVSGESEQSFELLTRSYHDFYKPATDLEEAFVTDLVSIHWNRQRIQLIEHGLYEMEFQNPAFEKNHGRSSDGAKLVLAFAKVAEKGIMTTVNRTLSRITREYGRVLQAFETHRRQPPASTPPVTAPSESSGASEPAELKNEKVKNGPIPDSGRSPAAHFAPVISAICKVFKFVSVEIDKPEIDQPEIAPGAQPLLAMRV